MYYDIAKEVIGAGGHKTIKYIRKHLPWTDENIALVASLNVVRRFRSPFDPSVEVVVIR